MRMKQRLKKRLNAKEGFLPMALQLALATPSADRTDAVCHARTVITTNAVSTSMPSMPWCRGRPRLLSGNNRRLGYDSCALGTRANTSIQGAMPHSLVHVMACRHYNLRVSRRAITNMIFRRFGCCCSRFSWKSFERVPSHAHIMQTWRRG